MPSAESTPACRGTITVLMSSRLAISHACMPPAPPKATSAKSRGSCPRSTETTRIARSMLALATRMMPSASAGTPMRMLPGDVVGDAAHAIDVERHAAAEKILDVEPAEQDVGVRDGELRARAVAHRTRHGAGAPRPHAQRAAAVDVRNRPAAGPDRVDVDHRQTHGKIADFRVGRRPDGAVDEADIGRRAAHVVRDHARKAGGLRDGPRPDDAGRGPRQHRAHGVRARGRGGDRSAVRLHDRQPRVAELRFECAEIAIDERRDVGVHDRRAPPLVLAILRQHVGRGRDAPPGGAEAIGDPLLVRRVGVGVQQTHRHDVRTPRRGMSRPHDLPWRRRPRRGRVLRRRAAREIPKVRSGSTIARGRGTKMLYSSGRVCRPMRTTSSNPSVTTSATRAPAPLEHRVGRHGRAMDNLVICFALCELRDAVENRARRIVGRRSQLEHDESAAVRDGRNQ